MSHHSAQLVSTQRYGLLSVFVLGAGIVINYLIRPDLFSPSIAYSVLGTISPTRYIFTASLLLTALLFYLESHYEHSKSQRIGSYIVSIGLVIVALVPINRNPIFDSFHGVGVTVAAIGLLSNVVIAMSARWPYISTPKKAYYLFLLGVIISSLATLILSNSRLHVLNLLGYAELSGLTAFAGWVLVDYGDKLMLGVQIPK